MEEVRRVAKVGSKRTPSHPIFCSEAQGGREDPKGASTPRKRNNGLVVKARGSWYRQESLTTRRNSSDGEKAKARFHKAD